ncbi:MAG TPA: fibronectin type III domain-containing protein [Catenuloplanes sp.]|jgi:hypothetical protein
MPDMPALAVTVVTAPGAPGRPAPPVDPAVVARTDTTVTVSWQPPAGSPPASRYVVYEGGRPVASTGGTSATVRGLHHATGYAFTIAAVDARGNESAGAGVAGRTATCQARPPRPVAVSARALSASSVRLDWVQEAAAVWYTVYDDDAVVGTSVGTATVVSGLLSASTHRLRVVAVLAEGCGETRASAAARVATPAGPVTRPTRPENLRIASADPLTGTVGLRWTQPAGDDPAIAHRLYRGAEVVTTATGTELAVRLPMATTQVLTVAAVDAAGLESAQSAPLTVQVPYLPPP